MNDLFLLFFIYSVLLWGGANCVNSYYDRDQDKGRPLNFLDHPPEVPRYLAYFGNFLMILGVILSFITKGFNLSIFAFISFIMSLYYSHNESFFRRGKEVKIMDGIINSLGYGTFAVLMGALFSRPIIGSSVFVLSFIFTITVFGSFPTTQLFQMKPNDSYSTYPTMVAFWGASRSLRICSQLLVLGWFFCLAFAYFEFKLSELSMLLTFISFSGLILGASFYTWNWSKTPFKDSILKYKILVQLLLGSRMIWVGAEVLAWSLKKSS